MRRLIGLSGEYVTFDQNVQKCKVEFEIFLRHRSGKINGFSELEVLIVHFDEHGRVNLEFQINKNSFRK